ncbi:hypothetical protein C3L50_08150 [Flavobacterium alvei]|uniref:Uncharacterized protein n=1 Tax=Flavobacterium alvei TaxID=2080416 RepID=A0A2S5ABN0_9FLAO|nr:hypothetical protein C3L50_08150 [Flavobacterium alvei]
MARAAISSKASASFKPQMARAAISSKASASFKLVPTINSRQNYNPKKVVVFLFNGLVQQEMMQD